MISFDVLKYIAEEVERQQDGPVAVYDMARAWLDAQSMPGPVLVFPTLRDIERWGQLVAPDRNVMGYRKGLVSVGGSIKKPWPMYLTDLKDLIEKFGQIAPQQAYYEFEMIHPFNDGNGRTGKILYNYLLDRLNAPIMPPNFFGCSNP